VATDDEDVDTAVSYTITVTVRNYLGQVVLFFVVGWEICNLEGKKITVDEIYR
jgi:hypothetical protein